MEYEQRDQSEAQKDRIILGEDRQKLEIHPNIDINQGFGVLLQKARKKTVSKLR